MFGDRGISEINSDLFCDDTETKSNLHAWREQREMEGVGDPHQEQLHCYEPIGA